MMPKEKLVEIKVGIFVLLGLACILGMVVYFGQLGEGVRKYYSLTVEFANAGGLLKGSDVMLGGARIGRVATDPVITNHPQALKTASAVVVPLRIFADVRIPAGSVIQVGSSGLLGDRFVDVIPPATSTEEAMPPGSLIAGRREAGLDDLQREGTDLIKSLRDTASTIDSMVKRLDAGLLSDENLANLRQTLENLRNTSAAVGRTADKISQSGDRLDPLLDKAETAMESASQAMDSAREATTELKGAAQEARTGITTARQVIEDAGRGKGTIGRLLTDQSAALELEAFLSNIRKHGILFYKDRSGEAAQPAASPAPRATPRRR